MEAKAGDDRIPPTPAAVFGNIKARRAAILKALTTDFDDFYHQCDPEKINLSLYANSNEEWFVGPPESGFSEHFPEPVLGINFARDGMERNDWLTLVASHSDSWLLAGAHFLGSIRGFSKSQREQVFDMINDLPTITEVVCGTTKEEKPSSSNPRKIKSKCKAKKKRTMIRSKTEAKENTCGACGGLYIVDEFWIFCDSCETWFHGQCVEVSPDMAMLIDVYECPACSKKKARKKTLVVFP